MVAARALIPDTARDRSLADEAAALARWVDAPRRAPVPVPPAATDVAGAHPLLGHSEHLPWQHFAPGYPGQLVSDSHSDGGLQLPSLQIPEQHSASRPHGLSSSVQQALLTHVCCRLQHSRPHGSSPITTSQVQSNAPPSPASQIWEELQQKPSQQFLEQHSALAPQPNPGLRQHLPPWHVCPPVASVQQLLVWAHPLPSCLQTQRWRRRLQRPEQHCSPRLQVAPTGWQVVCAAASLPPNGGKTSKSTLAAKALSACRRSMDVLARTWVSASKRFGCMVPTDLRAIERGARSSRLQTQPAVA